MTHKKGFLLLCMLIPFIGYGTSEKDSVSESSKDLPLHSIKTYPLSLFSDYLFNKEIILSRMNLVSYERKLYKNNTLSLSVGISSISFGSSGSHNGFGGELEYRYYITHALKGWYVGGVFLYSIDFWEIKGADVSISNTAIAAGSRVYVNTISVGPKFGYQFLWKKRNGFFTLDLGSGLGYTHVLYQNNRDKNLTINRLGLFMDVGLGYSFYQKKR